jgi:rhodanese-related sulfurtransferase
MKFRELKLRKDPDCPVCGTHPTVRALIDYDQFCGVGPAVNADSHSGVPEITVQELKAQLDRGERPLILDVREPQEYQINRIPGSVLIPLGDLPQRAHELDSARELVVHCKSGVRSARAVEFLRAAGFGKARNLKGGIVDWVDKIDPSQPRY